MSLLIAVITLGVCAMSWQFGVGVLHTWRYWFEISAILYLFAALFILLVGFLKMLLWASDHLSRRWPDAPVVGKVFGPAAALTIFLTLAVPFGIAFSFVYQFKLPNVVNPEQALGRAFAEVEFTSADGTTLRGWWVPARSPSSRTIVFCHGLAANRTQTLKFHEIGAWLDANLFLFDLRGHGESGGRIVSLGFREKDDVLSAIAWVRNHRPSESRQVIGMGLSLGASALAEAAGEVEPALNGVILDSGFTSTGDMTHRIPCPAFLHGWLLTVGLPIANWNAGCPITSFRPEASMSRLRAPVLIVHARDDFVTPFGHSQRLFEQAAEPKQLLIFENGGHCNGYFTDHKQYQAAIGKLAEQMR